MEWVHRWQLIVRSRWCDKPCWSLLWQQNSTAAIWRSFAHHSQWAHFGKRTEGGGINEPCRKRSSGFFQFCVWLLLHQKQQAPSCIEMREEAYNWGGSWRTQQTEDFWEHLMRILLSRILLSPWCQNRCLHLREEKQFIRKIWSEINQSDSVTLRKNGKHVIGILNL